MTCREATPSDHASWLRFRQALWPHCPDTVHREDMAGHFARGGTVMLAFTADGEPVGFAEISLRGDPVEGSDRTPVPYLEGWYVEPGARRCGAGKMLVESAAAWASAHGHTQLASDALIGNDAAIRAHLRSGFREIERTVHFILDLPGGQESSTR